MPRREPGRAEPGAEPAAAILNRGAMARSERPERRVGAAGAITPRHAAFLFTALTIGLTWPQVLHLGRVPDQMDSYFNLWRLAWIAHQLPTDPWHLFDANIFFPLRFTLAYSDAILLQGLLAAPWIWLGVPVVYVSNALVLGSFVACGIGAFLLVRELTADAAAACVAGLIFAFAPFRFDHYYHLELLWAQWLPLTLWMVHRTLTSGRLAHGLWAGVFLALQGLSCIYYTVFFAVVLIGLAPALWAGAAPASRRRAFVPLLAGLILAASVLAVYALPYRAARSIVGDRDDASIRLYSAGPVHYLAALPNSIVYGGSIGSLGRHEKRLFPGFVAIGLVAVALWPPIDRRRFAYALVLALAIDGTLGHRGLVFPWLRDHLAMFRGLRVPARFGHLVLLGACVLAGFGLSRLRTAAAHGHRALARAIPAVAGTVLIAEYLMWPMGLVPVQTRPDEVAGWLLSRPPGVVADLPLPTSPSGLPNEALVAYRSTFYWRPLVNGYSGYTPPSYLELWPPLAKFPDAEAFAALRRRGVTYLLVRQADYGEQRYAGIVRALAPRCDVSGAGPFGDPPSAVMIYTLLPPRPGCD